jgi:hypothetical protein
VQTAGDEEDIQRQSGPFRERDVANRLIQARGSYDRGRQLRAAPKVCGNARQNHRPNALGLKQTMDFNPIHASSETYSIRQIVELNAKGF